jgi:hypothetical protein
VLSPTDTFILCTADAVASPDIDACTFRPLPDTADDEDIEPEPSMFKVTEPVVTSMKPSIPVEMSRDSVESTATVLATIVVVCPANAAMLPPDDSDTSSDDTVADPPA